ncbi:hypothetical protein C4D60_Mb08t23270 [Musa balbisiana]|uniref:Uncharacterized protein n=1 Tax=Musa balbisiana TaxID=52838 RepID=A0A4S8K5W4_MUSBA|nr:hypothetical protein C4D60_Mb08t23270 [Musa balbisiana]
MSLVIFGLKFILTNVVLIMDFLNPYNLLINSTKPLLPSRALYTRNLPRVNDQLKSFQSYLKWMCVD